MGHATAEGAEEEMAIPVITGAKTESEKFAGAERTYCIEAILRILFGSLVRFGGLRDPSSGGDAGDDSMYSF